VVVTLVPMTSEEKRGQLERSREQYTLEMAGADGLEVAEAARRVQDQLEQLLPEGVETAEHLFMWIVANDDPGRVGWTWVGPALGVSGDSYIYEIEVDAGFRGSGLGGSALDQIEILVREAGAGRLGLHIFEANAAARHLYEGKGFVVTRREPGHIEMWKDLVNSS